MARIRTVKPDFFTHEGLAEFSVRHRLLFIGLWTMADRVGRLQDRPRRIRAAIFPYDDSITAVVVDEMLSDLQAHREGFLIRYQIESLSCIQINAFLRHQRPTEREPDSELPAPLEWDQARNTRKSPSAEQLLSDLLADGPRLAAEVRSAATRIGVSERSLRRARVELGVNSEPVIGDSRRKIWSMDSGQNSGQLAANYRQLPAKIPAKNSKSNTKASNGGPKKYRPSEPEIPAKHAGKGREELLGIEALSCKDKAKEKATPTLSRQEIELIFGSGGSPEVTR